MTFATTSQLRDILDHLRSGDSLTQDGALEKFGCGRLAARIHDLRVLGHGEIRTRTIQDDRGHRVAEYFIGESA
jgi:hypothetical protein